MRAPWTLTRWRPRYRGPEVLVSHFFCKLSYRASYCAWLSACRAVSMPEEYLFGAQQAMRTQPVLSQLSGMCAAVRT